MSVVFDVQGPGHSVNWKLSFRFRLQVGFLGYVVYWIRLTQQSHVHFRCTVHTQRIDYVVILDFVIRSWSYMYSEINNKQMKYTKEQHMFVTENNICL